MTALARAAVPGDGRRTGSFRKARGKHAVQIDPRVPGLGDDLAAARAVRMDANRK
jgi:hypothetical protein